ncbi:hypothetical protein P167DRAFT_534937 [Morchella conica CCBAS932]|uniref:Arginyl-tRNA--protein transferase 1 n=1 Tax=Morchella conica CCBAS932 TaxID=1392247 RepID=A0A3N4KVU2_9PEZI|nr:hypothetical protein P167DRAFT_534937 [Morchella conica CCBAS932]
MSNDAHDPVTLISYVGSSSGNRCGYCKTSFGSCSFYLRAQQLSVHHYELLINRGWRRSGSLLYKPHMKITCCPQYTIRLDTHRFKPSRDQRQCLHKWSRYILGEEYIREAAKLFPKSKEEKKKQKNEFDLIESVHAPEYSTIQHQTPPEPAHRLEINLEASEFSKEKYALFEDYQRNIHKEDTSESGFRRFLCASPLTYPRNSDKKLGSFHQCYRVDGRLVAMAVLDLLPNSVSGVYFMYHQDYAKWSFGKLSACREAALAKEGGYRYYNMGYYIQSCPKMLYKMEYSPSDLLDPETYEWNPLNDDLKNLLNKSKYVCPSEIRARMQSGDNVVVNDKAKGIEEPGEEEDETNEENDEVQDPGYVFKTKMPGLLTDRQLKEFDVGNVNIDVAGTRAQAKDLVGFEDDTVIHSLLKETVATVGIEVAKEMIITLG